MGLFTLKRGFTTRCLAVAFVCYSALASARGLVPQLCATLSSLPGPAAAHCEEPVSCCTKSGPTSMATLVSGHHDCAFCLIVHTPAQPVSMNSPVPPSESTELRLARAEFSFADPLAEGANACRAPPFS